MSEFVEMSEINEFDPDMTRFIFANPGDNEPFLYAKVTMHQGDNRTSIPCKIDQATGLLNIDPQHLFNNDHGVESYAMAMEPGNWRNLSAYFTIVIGHEVEEHVFLSQRQGRSIEYRQAQGGITLSVAEVDQVVEYTMPPCMVVPFDRPTSEMRDGLCRLGVRTNPMNRENSNRLDVWRISRASQGWILSLHCLYLVTLDDGRSFRLVHQKREEYTIYQRKAGMKFVLQTSDHRIRAAYNRSLDMKKMMGRFVFVPTYNSIESRLSVFEDERIIKLIHGLEDVSIWEGDENFTPQVPAGPIIKFLTYGHGNGSYGIVELPNPIEVGGFKHDSLQFAHDCVENGEKFRDEQGIYFFPAGTLVEVEHIVSMGFHAGQIPLKPYPPMACTVRVIA